MKKFLIYSIFLIIFSVLAMLGCSGSGDTFGTVSDDEFNAYIEGYVYKLSADPADIPSDTYSSNTIAPVTGESPLAGAHIVTKNGDFTAVVDEYGYFELNISDKRASGLNVLEFRNSKGTEVYGQIGLKIERNDEKLLRIKFLSPRKSEVIEIDSENRNNIINRYPIVDAGPDVFTNNFSSDPIRIITEHSYDPDAPNPMKGSIQKVYFDLDNDYNFNFKDSYKSKYIFSDRTNYFSIPGVYKVTVIMVDSMGGTGLGWMKVNVDSRYRTTNFRPLAYIAGDDFIQEGVIQVPGGENLTVTGYGESYNSQRSNWDEETETYLSPFTYNWEQTGGPEVSMNFSEDTSEMTFMPISGNTYSFNFYVKENNLESSPAELTVVAGEGSDDDGGGIIGVAEGFVFYEAENIIYRLNSRTGNTTKLTDNNYISTYPAISPDYQTIFFTSNKDDVENFDLYSMSRNGDDIIRIVQTENTPQIDRNEFMPYAASNSRIYFVYSNSLKSVSFSGQDIRTELTFNEKNVKFPAVNEDATKIVFSSNRDTNQNFELFIADLDESGRVVSDSVEKLTSGENDYYARFSKANDNIIFFRDNRSGQSNIYKLEFDTMNLISLVELYDNTYPVFSTDGSKIFFVSDRSDNLGEIFVMNSDGTDIRRLTDNSIKERFLVFGE
ncbi:MAG: TolB family protein [Candidatus Muiribacteriota bacterium]